MVNGKLVQFENHMAELKDLPGSGRFSLINGQLQSCPHKKYSKKVRGQGHSPLMINGKPAYVRGKLTFDARVHLLKQANRETAESKLNNLSDIFSTGQGEQTPTADPDKDNN